jgi:sugar (pentulose or hexulose) kinase
MTFELPRGIAVTDVGYTNTKLVLFDPSGAIVAERKVASRHLAGPPYRHIDPEPVVAFFRDAIPELDRILPVDVIVPCAHGAAMACVRSDGTLALPVMDYLEEPPPEIRADYLRIAPPFSEAYCGTLPVALTHGLQLYWQQTAWPKQFAEAVMLMPWIQYVGFRLSGVASTEITSMSCQTHLMNVNTGRPSSLAVRQGWDKHFPSTRKAWDNIGNLKDEFRGSGLRGRGDVLAGIHDSSANYVRYLAGGLGDFTLLSTGTWSISFDAGTPVSALDETRDTCTNTNVFGKLIATSRFFAGKEFEILSGGATEAPSLAAVAQLVNRETFALPSFSDSGGPVPHSGLKGRIAGKAPRSAAERVSMAALYCALMVSEQLNAIASKADVIVDGPFSENEVFLGLLAALRKSQRILASDIRDGTTAGAACLALMDGEKLPHVALNLKAAKAASVPGLTQYHERWKMLAYAS